MGRQSLDGVPLVPMEFNARYSRTGLHRCTCCRMQIASGILAIVALTAAVLSGNLNLAGLHRRLYGMRVLPTTPCKETPRYYLTMMTTFKNMKPYIQEWIEFHRLVGFEHFYLYNNNSTDMPEDVLNSYIRKEIATLVYQPSVFLTAYDGMRENYSQKTAILDALRRFRCQTRWMALLDMDEFLFSPTKRPIPELLKSFEPYGGISLAWLRFGTSSHMLPPPQVTIDGYRRRMRAPSLNWKNIVQTVCVAGIQDVHEVIYHSGYHSVDELHRSVARHTHRHVERSFHLFRLHHYFTRSWLDWWLRVYDRGSVSGSASKFKFDALQYYEPANELYDDTASFLVKKLEAAMHWNGAVWRRDFLREEKVKKAVAAMECKYNTTIRF